jgi:predicted RNase H-like HicB family nuclease
LNYIKPYSDSRPRLVRCGRWPDDSIHINSTLLAQIAINVYPAKFMRYPITIEPGTDTTAWGVVVPDLPGCFSAGDTLEEAMIQAEDAITGWIEAAIDEGQDIPTPSQIEALRAAYPEFDGWLWALVKVDPAILDNTLERVNISLPRRVLHRLDARARSAGETRSGFIARLAIEGRESVAHD